MARKIRARADKYVVHNYRSSGGYPYFKTIFLLIFVFSALFTVGILGILTIVQMIVVLVVSGAIILVVGLSPALTTHILGKRILRLRHGWYFSANIPLDNIRGVEETDEGIPGHGVSFLLGGNKIYLANSRVGLVKLKLTDRQRVGGLLGRSVSEIVINVDDPVRFIRDLRDRLGLSGDGATEKELCPSCGRPVRGLEEEDLKGVALKADRTDVPTIECIFLIHNDGRLITSYKSGKVKTKEAFSMTGMLTVIQDFVGDAFKRSGGSLRTLEHGDLKVIIERGTNYYLAVVIEGPVPEDIRDVMRRVLDELEETYGDVLDEHWDGEITNMDKMKRILAQILWF